MLTVADYWELLAGLSLFLFAMSQLEASLDALGGQSLTRYIKRQSENRFKAVLSGLVATALLQSSSLTGLMVLAFIGAGLLSLTAALGIIFGANLGSTFTGWIVTTLGFKVELAALSLPLIGFGGLVYMFARGRWADSGRSVLALGLLLLGLEFMKNSVASFAELADAADLANRAVWQYLLFGLVVAAVIQSSAATMMVTLAALYQGIITLPNAAAIAIGADLGTTSTIMLGALRGSVPKRQVAAGQFLFNLVTDAIAFTIRLPLLALIAWLGISDPLYALVTFHSLFNLLGLCLFVPFTTQFAAILSRLFPRTEVHAATYLAEVGEGAGDAAVQATEREAALLVVRVMRLVMQAFSPPLDMPAGDFPVPYESKTVSLNRQTFSDTYRNIKVLEGEVLDFAIRMQAKGLSKETSERLSQLLVTVREAMHAAKSIKDIEHNLAEFEQSDNAAERRYKEVFRVDMEVFFAELFDLRDHESAPVQFDDLVEALNRLEHRHDKVHEQIHHDIQAGRFVGGSISSVLNVNREILIAGRALIFALAYYHLDRSQAEIIARMPRAAQ
jgi:phosphate:Na+ symporter